MQTQTKLEKFRIQFPQYSDVSDEKLVKALHTKLDDGSDYETFANNFGFKSSIQKTDDHKKPITGILPLDVARESVSRLENSFDNAKDYINDTSISEKLDDAGNVISSIADYVSDRGGLGIIQDAGEALIVDPLKTLADSQRRTIDGALSLVTDSDKFEENYRKIIEAQADTVPVAAEAITGLRAASLVKSSGKALKKTEEAIPDFKSSSTAVKQSDDAIAALNTEPIVRQTTDNTGTKLKKPIESVVGTFKSKSKDELINADLLEALEIDGITSEELLIRKNAWKGVGEPTLLDLAGAGTEALANSLGKGVSGARDILKDFRKDVLDTQRENVLASAHRNLSPSGDFLKEFDDLKALRAENAKPLYEAAYTEQIQLTPKAQLLLKTTSGKAAIKNAQGLADELLIDLEAEGLVNGVVNENVSGRLLDFIKQGFDVKIEQYRNTTTGKLVLNDPQKRAENATLRTWLEEVDKTAPIYAAARKAYSGPTQSMEALVKGRSFLKGATTPDKIQAIIDDLSPGDLDFYRAGVLQSISDKIEALKDNSNVAQSLIGSPSLRKKISIVFDGDADTAQKFIDELTIERNRVELANSVAPNTGSATAKNQADIDFFGAGTNLITGNARSEVTSLVSRFVQNFRSKKVLKRRNEADTELAELLTRPINDETLQRIEKPKP